MNNIIRFIAATVFIAVAQISLAATQPSKPIIIEWYGDSTTTGVTFAKGRYGKVTNTESRTVQDMLNKKFGKNTVIIKNRGAGGTTANQLINGTFNYSVPYTKQLQKGKADIAIINFGINDCYTPGYTPAMFAKDITDLVQLTRDSGKTPIIQTPNPIDNAHNEWLWAFQHDASVVGLNMNVPVIDQWSFMMKNTKWQSLLGDKIHPTKSGYDVKSRNSFATLSPIIEAMIKERSLPQ